MKKFSYLDSWKLRNPELFDKERKIVFDFMPEFDYKKFINYPIEERSKLINDYFKETGEKIIKKFGFEHFNWSNKKIYRSVTIETNLKKFKFFEKSAPKKSSIFIKNIEHARSTYKPTKFNYYCIRMTVSFSFEGFNTGMQSWEERFILLKAKNYDDACRKAESYKKKSLYKFLNSDQRLVGEKVVSIDDVCEIFTDNLEEEINSLGSVEVYYKRALRKMTKKRYWDVTKE